MIREIAGSITTTHGKAACVAAALAPDNMDGMDTMAREGRVITRIQGTRIRTVTASVDDYLMNLALAEDAYSAVPGNAGPYGQDRTGQ
jgi:hypothetical protein